MPPIDHHSVLVVDDDPDICEAVRTVLECEGYHVIVAEDGAEALEKLRAGETPGLILLDLMMPRMSGVEFRVAQLRDPALAAIPVVIISAGGDVLAKAAAMGLLGLTKPVDLDVLLDTVRRYAGAPMA